MIKEIQSFWAESEKKRIKTVAEQFHLSLPCAKKYIYMSSKELEELDLSLIHILDDMIYFQLKL